MINIRLRVELIRKGYKTVMEVGVLGIEKRFRNEYWIRMSQNRESDRKSKWNDNNVIYIESF